MIILLSDHLGNLVVVAVIFLYMYSRSSELVKNGGIRKTAVKGVTFNLENVYLGLQWAAVLGGGDDCNNIRQSINNFFCCLIGWTKFGGGLLAAFSFAACYLTELKYYISGPYLYDIIFLNPI